MNNKQIPNILTIFRIALIPILIASFYIEGSLYHWVAAGLFLVASITDFFDGYLARALKAQSNFGIFLDPIADKLLVAAAILMLVHFEHIGRYDIIPAIAILSREIMVSGLREFLAKLNVSVPVTNLAKVKTAIQMIAIFLLLLGVEGPTIIEVEEITETNLTEFLGKIMLWVSAVLTLITGYA
jgi:CDP-diacylglycerol--glycerol-3-phosphate 3-phosphatidyltransferase